MKIATYNNGEFIKIGYPRKDFKPVEKLEKGIQFYYIEENRPDYSPEKSSLKKVDGLELTEDKHEEYPHILKAIQNYEVIDYTQSQIINNLNRAVGEWIEERLPVWKQVKYISRFMYLDILAKEGTATTEQLQEMEYLNDLDNWVIKCRADRDLREQEYLNNGIFPSFIFDEMPLKTF